MKTLSTPTSQAGFSLIELMIGMLIGLLCTLVIATVLSSAEGQRRGTTTGTDAQIAGNLALFHLQRDVASSGYGFASEESTVGCALEAFYGGVAASRLPSRLVPVIITQGASAAVSDSIRVISSSKGIDPERGSSTAFAVPARVEPAGESPGVPGYNPGDTAYGVASSIGFNRGDLVVAVPGTAAAPPASTSCELFQINADVPASGRSIPRLNDAAWNPAGHPSQVANSADTSGNNGAYLINLGRLIDRSYSVDADRLVVTELDTAAPTTAPTPRELQSGIVLMKALYGRDTNNDQAIDTFDYCTPATQRDWADVLAVRVALVARSAQREKDEVTAAFPQWDVGNAYTTAGASTCGSSKCIALDLGTGSEWKHYRYKVYDTVIPLRNQRFRSGNVVRASRPAAPGLCS